ncbi:Rap1a/Tai family immunity protein [Rhizobium laguerreae]|uniref:Rap1a/Tai family immunity protein n=1 Tax=Rhizobium laguerreae TaxID=1076926 RepID=UPI002F2B1A58
MGEIPLAQLVPIPKYVGEIKAGICVPPKVTLGQMVDVLCKYLGDHSEDRQLSMAGHFRAAYSRAWPCKVD